jgi:SNF2 family DNA or RNA helicase
MQICCGVVYYGEGGSVSIDAKSRMDACNELVESAENKTVVFVPFTAALDRLAAFLRKKGHSVAVVDGRTSAGKRKKIFADFQEQPHPKVLVAHPKTTAHGLTLTAADTTVWYAPVFSLEVFEQANNRMDRPGQTSHMTVAMLQGCKLEREIYAALSGRARMQDSMLHLYKEELTTT